MIFNQGQKVKSVRWNNGLTIVVDDDHIKDMEISMENGHTEIIAFVKITYDDGSVGMVYTGEVFVILEARCDRPYINECYST